MGKGKKLLITGGRGMVGRNLIACAARSGWEIIAPTSVDLDLRNAEAVEQYIRRQLPDVVVHAAGVVGGIHANIADPIHFLADNAAMALNVVMSSFRSEVVTLINLSSSCMYPACIEGPLKECDILRGPFEVTNEGYALAKTVGLKICEYIDKLPNFNYKTLIACNLYGVGDNFDPRRSHLLPAIIEKIHKASQCGSESVSIWGDGTARREFMFAYDFAKIIIKALEVPELIPSSMNVGVGKDLSVLEYYSLVARVIGWSGEFVYDLNRPVGMRSKLMDITHLTALGWVPERSLEGGIRSTYQYYITGNEVYE
uniref:GDP-L-fucose synthase n=1 Tax=Azorhizobium caulinodans (strain ATCC 43989 / DSM 5975 / JCM 20966 / LMG 6465 / NBRC 14845 / NCIMB 13405 / ORS 571) TaxID=438753 RepID=FCL_AZOC5|nr:RecName: Full=GDP-L-fucose synthase; AltName: Full=GDP-4-keto-6-deoxy-D-mannose-3,5-epimerase-4-reductase; AltName: Full=Nodulation protein NolK [Azorhizobium caulinodans ORS 571]